MPNIQLISHISTSSALKLFIGSAELQKGDAYLDAFLASDDAPLARRSPPWDYTVSGYIRQVGAKHVSIISNLPPRSRQESNPAPIVQGCLFSSHIHHFQR